jgi:iron complex transport system substrate-binding protein
LIAPVAGGPRCANSLNSARLVALLLTAFALLLAACGAGDGAKQTATADLSSTPGVRLLYPLTVPGTDGRSVTFLGAPGRIVSLSPGHTEILYAVGAGGQLAGTDRFSDYPEAAKALPKIDYSNPNMEALVALRPDLLIASGRQRNQVPAFEQAGLRVLLLEEPGSVAGVLERIRLLGRITGHPEEGETLASRLQERVTAVTDRLTGVSGGPRVYHEIDPKLYSAAPSSFVGDLYVLLKAQNIAPSGGNSFPQLTAEAIIRADPEVIVLGDGIFPGGTPEEVKRRPGWSTISAVRNNRVYPVDDNTVSRPGPRVVDGLEQVARMLYPDQFR